VADDLTEIKNDLAKIDESVSGKDGLLVRAAVMETRMGNVEDTLKDQGTKIDALGTSLSNHMTTSAAQHGALSTKVDNLVSALASLPASLQSLATKEDVKAIAGRVDEVEKCEEEEAQAVKNGVWKYLNADNAKTIGTVLGTAIVTAAAYWGISLGTGPATAGTAPPQHPVVEQHVAVPAPQQPEDGPGESP
jgi:hypothetical protein